MREAADAYASLIFDGCAIKYEILLCCQRQQSCFARPQNCTCVRGRQGEAAAERAVVNDSPVVKRQAAAGGRCRLAAEVKK